MMKLKQYLRNSARPALPLFSLISCLLFLGCNSNIEPTYKEEDIPSAVQKICKEEYSLDVKTERTQNTLWIYAPLSKILHKEFIKNPDKMFDEEIAEKLRNIFTTIGRVVMSADKTPDFFCLVASDINLGLDYTIIGNTLDIKKSYAGIIPWPEANRRYVINFDINEDAIGDLYGEHIKAQDIEFGDFLAKQIAQRFDAKFQENESAKYFKPRRTKAKFKDNILIIQYEIAQILPPPKKVDIVSDIVDIAAYCIKTYEFKDFDSLQITDMKTKATNVFSASDMWARKSP